MTDRYFPISSPTACRLKWSWSTIYLNSGKTGSCHRASISELSESDFDSFHNTPAKLAGRQKMLSGEWPLDGCEYCMEIEHSNGISDRMFQLKVPNIYPPELDADPLAITVTPAVLEVFFSNTCNFRCVYCDSSLSSSIMAEEERWNGPIIAHTHTREQNQYKNLIPKFWSWLERHGQSLKRLQLLGGEPLLQDDFHKILEYLSTNPNPRLELNFVTNLHVPDKMLHNIQSKLLNLLDSQCIGRVDIQISVDCWGPGQEYVRHGFDSKTFEQNLKTITQHNRFRVGLLSTVNSLTIHEMPALAIKIKEWSAWQPVFWYMHLVLPNNTSAFSPLIFDPEIFFKALEQTKILLPRDNWDQQQTFDIFEGIQNKIKTHAGQDPIRQKQLVGILDEIDRRRGTDWRKTFPWLTSEIQNVV